MIEHRAGTGGHCPTHDRDLPCETCMVEASDASGPTAAERASVEEMERFWERVLAASARKIVGFEQYAGSNPDVERDARAFRAGILDRTKPIGDAPQGSGVPLYDSDMGFYVAYRTGHPVAAVKTPNGLTFYGTDGSTTLEAAGIKVDKPLSPVFGIVFPPTET